MEHSRLSRFNTPLKSAMTGNDEHGLIATSFDGPTIDTFLPHTPKPVLLGENTDLAIRTTNETAQCPTDDAHDDGAEERIPKPINVKARHESSRKPECQRIHDEDEEPQRDDNKWQAQEQKNRTDKCIDDPEEQRHKD